MNGISINLNRNGEIKQLSEILSHEVEKFYNLTDLKAKSAGEWADREG
jgi:hypothetical protein